MGTLPNTTSEIEAGWLNEALPDHVRRGRTVTDVRAEVIGEGVGFMGEVARLHLAYDEPDAGAAPSVISKMPTANEGFKHVGTMLGLYEKEARFYEEVAPEVEMRIPEAYCNLRDGAQWVLLLEDLAPMRPGNQLASCTREEAITASQTVARLHARWWEDPRLDDFADWLPGPRSPYFDILKGAYLQSVQPFHDHWSHLVPDEIETLVDRVAEDYESFADAGASREPHSFIHGDYRLDNMMFPHTDGDPPFALLDFQLPFKANPLWDVVYFLAGNFPPDWRREHEAELIACYHDTLRERGVEDFTLDDCWDNYRAAALVLMGYIVTMANDVDMDTLDDRGRELLATMFERYSLAILDLQATDYLA